MTEYWVSNAKYWCELCKCWLPDTVQARTNHENGSGHKIAMQRKLREMRLKADREKQEEEKNKKELQRIEQAAGQAYEKDVARLDTEAPPMPPPAQPPPQFGSWKVVDTSPYLFNAALQWYYDKQTGFYYGGDPPAWTQAPAIPQGALYASLSAGKDAPKKIIKGKLPPQLANLGGYQAPLTGSITRGAVGAPAKSSAASKRERESSDAGAGLSEQEEAERRRREEARKRVQARTAAAFGLQ